MVGVFQVESGGMRRALVDMRPDRFEDLIALVALYRPGPMANIPTYCARKRGDEQVEYLHPLLEPILAPTYGVITYQEQVQQIAKSLAGYTLAEADLLRRAMGKKIKAEMDVAARPLPRGRRPSAASAQGSPSTIFDACAKFAEYGFNKSHSAPYAYITYQTAYLKAHHAAGVHRRVDDARHGQHRQAREFRARRQEARHRGRAALRQPLGGDVHGARRQDLLRHRRHQGRRARRSPSTSSRRAATSPFTDLADFAARVDPRIINRRTLETLVNAGAFDRLVPQARAGLCGDRRGRRHGAAARDRQVRRHHGHVRLRRARADRAAARTSQPWTLTERLEREFAAIGFHLSAHPLDPYADLFDRLQRHALASSSSATCARGWSQAGRLAGTIAVAQRPPHPQGHADGDR